jgi:hypothetical protein
MMPVPEPRHDIEAQLLAAIDPDHPKQACFCVQADAFLIPPAIDAYRVHRPEGVLVTLHKRFAEAFERSADDTTMAWILGYPESKDVVVQRCHGDHVNRARAVQARDDEGCVITEAYCSPTGFLETCEAMQRHVPDGGELVVLAPIMSISRRVAMRWCQR